MSKTDPKFLITGVGAIIGQGLVKTSLESFGKSTVIGLDRKAESVGRYWCHQFIQKPELDEASDTYLSFWLEMLERNGIEIVLPAIDEDVEFLSGNREKLQESGVRIVLNSPSLIDTARDKWQLAVALGKIGLPVIPYAQPSDWVAALEVLGEPPFVLKPTIGSGSRGLALIGNEEDFVYWRARQQGKWMLQTQVGSDDDEYTVGTFGLGDGQYIGPIILRRLLSPAGNTAEAVFVPRHRLLEEQIETLCREFKPLGPTNFQFRVEGDTAFLLEINPRFSSSNSLRAAFGFNEVTMSVDLYLRGVKPAQPNLKPGRAWRYTADYVVIDSDYL